MLVRLPEAHGSALAGGAALIVRGDVERLTRDLDFFAPPGTDVGRLAAAAGMRVETLRVSATFARLMVHRCDIALLSYPRSGAGLKESDRLSEVNVGNCPSGTPRRVRRGSAPTRSRPEP